MGEDRLAKGLKIADRQSYPKYIYVDGRMKCQKPIGN